MDCLIYNPKISEAFETVRKFSFDEKKETLLDETKVNSFLDKILELQKMLSLKTQKINNLIENVERITWFDNLDNTSLLLINDLISAIRDLRTTLQKQYIALALIRTKGIAKIEIKNFKSAIEDLSEMATDLESTFFHLPNIKEFKETTKQLSLI